MIEIEQLSTENPRQFWEHLKKLGPISKKKIPMEVYDDEGQIVTDTECVLNKWGTEFEKLHKGQDIWDQEDESFCYRYLNM